MRFEVRAASALAVSADTAWQHATTLAGIQAELPWPVRLRTRPHVTTLDQLVSAPRTVEAVLCLGPLPVVRWTPGVELLDVDERRFIESSTDMNWMRAWRHERRVIDLGDGRSRVEDHVTGSSSLPVAGLVVRALFAARHRRLRRW